MAAKKAEVKKPLLIKVNFSEVKTEDLTGKEMKFDASKDLGNMLYRTTADLGDLDLAQRIYKGGVIELSVPERDKLKSFIGGQNCNFLAIVKKAILGVLG